MVSSDWQVMTTRAQPGSDRSMAIVVFALLAAVSLLPVLLTCGATIKMRIRIASPELLPKTGPLPHLICSRQSNLGSGDEEGEHGDTSGIDFGDQGALRLGRAAGKGKDSG